MYEDIKAKLESFKNLAYKDKIIVEYEKPYELGGILPLLSNVPVSSSYSLSPKGIWQSVTNNPDGKTKESFMLATAQEVCVSQAIDIVVLEYVYGLFKKHERLNLMFLIQEKVFVDNYCWLSVCQLENVITPRLHGYHGDESVRQSSSMIWYQKEQ